jgi:hypothetical protein
MCLRTHAQRSPQDCELPATNPTIHPLAGLCRKCKEDDDDDDDDDDEILPITR